MPCTAGVSSRTRGGGLLQEDTEEKDPRRQRPASMSSVSRFSGALRDLRTGQHYAMQCGWWEVLQRCALGLHKHKPQFSHQLNPLHAGGHGVKALSGQSRRA